MLLLINKCNDLLYMKLYLCISVLTDSCVTGYIFWKLARCLLASVHISSVPVHVSCVCVTIRVATWPTTSHRDARAEPNDVQRAQRLLSDEQFGTPWLRLALLQYTPGRSKSPETREHPLLPAAMNATTLTVKYTKNNRQTRYCPILQWQNFTLWQSSQHMGKTLTN